SGWWRAPLRWTLRGSLALRSHLMYGRLPMSRARQVGETLNRLCAKLAANALDLVDAFGYGDDHRRATIATGIEAERQAEAAAYYRRARAQRDYPVPE
ncbi:hypothetical protein KCW65_23740, partial [Mycobacterium tuberculosis]|nr:hypothetical protein [Mycobacterium tuberculosis]